jgi:hypothetical protein
MLQKGKIFSILGKYCMFRTCFSRGKGQNYENQNVKNQKELRKLRRRSERRNGLFS